MARDESDHGIDREAFRGVAREPSIADEPALGNLHNLDTEEDHVRASVWDEPVAHAPGVVQPEEASTYTAWYMRKQRETSLRTALYVTLLLALSGGPFSILGAFASASTGSSGFGVLLIVVVAPVLEEMLKVGATLITLERKPYLFKSSWQIFFAVVASAFCFAVIENLLYINFYIDDPSPEIIQWRWTVCTFLHVGCSTIAALGLVRMFRAARKHNSPPEVHLASPMLVAAMLLHGSYNASALLVEFFITPM